MNPPEAFDPGSILYPVIHRAKVPFRPDISVPDDFTERALTIQRLDHELDGFHLSGPDYMALVKEAYDVNIHFSTKLEGNPLGLDEVRPTTRRALALEVDEIPPDAPHQEILNHLRVWIQPDMYVRPWRISHLTDTHRILLTGVDETSEPGSLRTTDDVGVESDVGELLLKPAPAKTIVRELESLLDWVNHKAPAFDPVVAATVFFHEFESIHPFVDGNGRVGRTLFHAYLQENGLPNAHRCVIEPHLAGNRSKYYDLLAWTDHSGDYRALVDHFSSAILIAYKEAVERFREKDLLSSDLDETSKQLLKRARRHKTWFNAQEASRWVQATTETVRRHLNDLVALQALEDNAKQTRAKRYRFANPFERYLRLTKRH